MNNFAKLRHEDTIIFDEESRIEDRYSILPAGIYEPFYLPSMISSELMFRIIKTDALVKFESGITKEICDKVDNFFKEETINKYKQLAIAHKLGILLYGPAGTGKTSTVILSMLSLIDKHQAICLDMTKLHPEQYKHVIDNIRRYQDSPIIILIDEFEHKVKNYEHLLLTFLDGITSNKNLIVVACTNYLNKIPTRIRNRKSRIKHVLEVKTLPSEVYREYISKKLTDISRENLDKFVFIAAESNLTMDEIKNAVIDYKIDNISIEESIKNAKTYAKIENSDNDD